MRKKWKGFMDRKLKIIIENFPQNYKYPDVNGVYLSMI